MRAAKRMTRGAGVLKSVFVAALVAASGTAAVAAEPVVAAEPAIAAEPTVAAEPAEPEGKLSVVPFALPAYQPETGFMVAGAAILAYQPAGGSGRKESSLMLAGAASLGGQLSLLLQPEWYFADDRLQLNGLAGVERFPDQFYGIGNDTRAEDVERYTPDYLELSLNPCWRVLPSLYVGPVFRLQESRMNGLEPGGLLAQGTLPGSNGGTAVQLGASAVWDRRDSTLYPREGTLLRLTFQSALPALGSTFEYTALKTDARGYLTLPWGRHVLAAQLLVELRSGEPPLYDLGRLGGPASMRGHYAGRYRDRQLAAAQLEYRAPLFWRIGAVAFASAGNVARDPLGLLDSAKLAGGLGLRWAPIAEVPVNIRLDVAYGTELAFYLKMGESF